MCVGDFSMHLFWICYDNNSYELSLYILDMFDYFNFN